MKDFNYVNSARDFVGIYFGDAMQPSSTKFTPRLSDFFGELPDMSIVYVSYDKSFKKYKEYLKKMPWVAMPYGSKLGNKLKLICRCQSLPHLTILRKDGTIAAYDGITLIEKNGTGAFISLLKSEGGFVRTFAPLKVTFDYFGYLKDKYKRELDAQDEEGKDKWDELPIRSSLKYDAMAGTLPEEPEGPYERKAFILSKTMSRPPVNYDDMPIPTAANMQRRMKGTFEEPKNGGLIVTAKDIEKQEDPSKFM